ncbi:MAG: rubrerythrin family protein [Treponema sp.]|jgi:rubrerythrin|nr:rubrerythrin family protein [Treponema sp.]
MDKIRGTKTEKNLMSAFVGESQARNRYTFYASTARKEGFIQIAEVFAETAEQEKEHAKRFFRLLDGGEVKIEQVFAASSIGTTFENLIIAVGDEEYEWKECYPAFAKTAEAEGFPAIAAVFRAIAVAEQQHAARFEALKKNIDSNKVFKKDDIVRWRCINCGYVHEGTEAPQVCPACSHPQAYFEILAENW